MDIFEIADEYDIGGVRRLVVEKCRQMGFSELAVGEIAIVVSELCVNMVKHKVVNGRLLVACKDEGTRTGIEITAEDMGPGIANVEEAMRDGVSTTGTLGGGLGAVRRLMDEFAIYSRTAENNLTNIYGKSPGCGTVIICRKWLWPGDTASSDTHVSVLSVPYPGSPVNGDGYYVKSMNGREIVALIDGLGHGLGAFEVTQQALAIIERNEQKTAAEMMRILHNGLMRTRGAVAGITVIDKTANVVGVALTGNIDCRYIYGRKTEHLLSMPGIVGATGCAIKSYEFHYSPGAALVLCTDGISAKWSIDDYPEVMDKSPTVLTNLIMRDFGRHNDDATVIAIFFNGCG